MKFIILLALAAAAGYYAYTHDLISGVNLKKEAQDAATAVKDAAQNPAEAGKKAGAELKKLKTEAQEKVEAAKDKGQKLSADLQRAKEDAEKLKKDAGGR